MKFTISSVTNQMFTICFALELYDNTYDIKQNLLPEKR